jgi:hypothetical protein
MSQPPGSFARPNLAQTVKSPPPLVAARFQEPRLDSPFRSHTRPRRTALQPPFAAGRFGAPRSFDASTSSPNDNSPRPWARDTAPRRSAGVAAVDWINRETARGRKGTRPTVVDKDTYARITSSFWSVPTRSQRQKAGLDKSLTQRGRLLNCSVINAWVFSRPATSIDPLMGPGRKEWSPGSSCRHRFSDKKL